MAQKKDSKNIHTSKTPRLISSRVQPNIISEANLIIKRAQNYDSRIVTLGSLIFFSTDTGDAWILDPEDRLALCLARDGEKQSFHISETPTSFVIEWNADYRIESGTFIVVERSGRIRTILGYPVAEILQATRRDSESH
jgi:hypothetical protein